MKSIKPSKAQKEAESNASEPTGLEDNLSQVEEISIPLPYFKFYHGPSTTNEVDDKFIGREDKSNELKNWLSSEKNTGSYLITGYRGMGKSSFVGKALNEITKILKKEKPLVVNLNLGGEIEGERDILSLISYKLGDEFSKKHINKQYKSIYWIIKNLISIILSVGCILICREIFLGIESVYYENFHNRGVDGLFYNVIRTINDGMYKLRPFGWLGHAIILVILTYLFYLIINKIIDHFEAKYSGENSAKNVYKKIKSLNERIDSAINEDNDPYGRITTSVLGIEVKQKRLRSYQPATVREIEQELLNIIESVSKKVRIIIVLDELDKVNLTKNIHKCPERGQNDNQSLNDDSIPEFGYDSNGFPGGISSRVKKQNVLHILAQLKFFVSTAKAKFIFISGRELYDAYLADVSDRGFSISSIFNGVINVDSFLSCESPLERDVRAMTEQYVCKILISKTWNDKKWIEAEPSEKYTLKFYYKYLYCTYKGNFTDNREKIEKSILFLYQFISYLTYVSNGAPKRMTALFEEYVNKDNSNDYNLVFTGHNQLKIAFIHHMAFPIFQAIMSTSNQYSDKMLVSTSFIIDHIFKYHSGGFSWRNIEYTPELMEINRTPELRDFINYVLLFLKQTYLSSISCGLFHYKFPKGIAEEISIISKRYDDISAIYNFSLGDSRAVKMYYMNLLKYYSTPPNSSKHTLANIHTALGDLYMTNEEYNEAISEYRIAIGFIKYREEKESINNVRIAHLSIHIMSQIRTMLKLALVYEKRHTADSAYITYSELVNLLINFRHVNESHLGLEFVIEKNIDNTNKRGLFIQKNKKYTYYLYDKDNINPNIITSSQKEDVSYWIDGDKMIPKLSMNITPEKSGLITKLSLFEDLRLAYIPSLAKLFVLEKMELGGIAKSNLDVIEAEHFYLNLTTNSEEKYIISADFFRKLGDIMYYKNSLFNHKENSLDLLLQSWGYNIKSDFMDYCHAKKVRMNAAREILNLFDRPYNEYREFLSTKTSKTSRRNRLKNDLKRISGKKEELHVIIENIFQEKPDDSGKYLIISDTIEDKISKMIMCCEKRKHCFESKTNINLPCYACRYYNRSLSILQHRLLKDTDFNNPVSKVFDFLQAIEELKFLSISEANFNQIAFTLEALGNTMLCCSRERNPINNDFFDNFSELLDSSLKNTNRAECVIECIDRFKKLTYWERAVLFYWTAACYHKKASNLKESLRCYVRILNLITTAVPNPNFRHNQNRNNKRNNTISKIENIAKVLFRCATTCAYSNDDYICMEDMQKLKWIFSREMYEDIDLKYLSSFSDIQEVILACYELKLEIYYTDKKRSLDIFRNMYSCSIFRNKRLESTIYNKAITLRIKESLNNNVLEYILNRYKIEDNGYSSMSKYIELINKIAHDNKNDCNKNYIAKIESQIMYRDHESRSVLRNNFRDNFRFLEFLIKDSIYCLTEIIETIMPLSGSTLFTNGFIGDLYYSLFKWNVIFDTLYKTYRCIDHPNESDKIIELLKRRNKNIPEKYIQSLKDIKKAQDEYKRVENNDAHGKESSIAEAFFNDIFDHIGKFNIHFLSPNHSAEKALKYYIKAYEMHSEGNSYKEFISNMYILDDDLQNNTCQFYLGLERFRINTEDIKKRMNYIKEEFGNSVYFNLSTYEEYKHTGEYFSEKAWGKNTEQNQNKV